MKEKLESECNIVAVRKRGSVYVVKIEEEEKKRKS